MAADLQHWMSVDDYLQLDRASQDVRYEYIDGHAYALAGGTIAHARIALNMTKLLDERLQEPCHVYTSDVRVRLSESRYVYPDITVSCAKNDWQEQADTVHSPSLVVEVLSPTTERYDRGKKFAYYQKCPTIREYVLVNAQFQGVEIFCRKGDMWIYQRFTPGQQVVLESLDIRFPVTLLYERVEIPIEEEDLPESPSQD